MRSTKKLGNNHVKIVAYHHWFAVHSRASCKRDTKIESHLGLKRCFFYIEWYNIKIWQLTGNVMKQPEHHLHMIPHKQGAKP